MNIKKLAEVAKKHNICGDGLNRILKTESKEELLDYFIEGIDFCLSEDFPTKEFIKMEGGDLLVSKGIYVDEKCILVNRPTVVLLGDCDASISIDGYAFSEIFIKHTTKAKVSLTGHSFARIDCFDNSDLFISASENSKVMVNVYGAARVVYKNEDRAMVKVIHKGRSKY